MGVLLRNGAPAESAAAPTPQVFLTDEHLVLVLEYAAGGDLAGHIPVGTGLPESEARWIFQQVLFALHYCHRMVSG
jgi:serine/threonine-protein kinase SRK2